MSCLTKNPTRSGTREQFSPCQPRRRVPPSRRQFQSGTEVPTWDSTRCAHGIESFLIRECGRSDRPVHRTPEMTNQADWASDWEPVGNVAETLAHVRAELFLNLTARQQCDKHVTMGTFPDCASPDHVHFPTQPKVLNSDRFPASIALEAKPMLSR